MDSEDTERRLDRLAHQPAPPVSEAFADRLESHLRVTAANSGGPARRPLWQPVAGAILTAVVLVAGTIGLLRAQNSDADVLVLSAAQETEVILPDGTALAGNAGLPLPNGTRVEVGTDGSATIDDVVLAGGAIVVVVDNRLEIISDAAPVVTASPSTTASPPTTTLDRPNPTTSADPPRTSTTRDRVATSAQPNTVPPDRSTSIRTTQTTSARSATAPTTEPFIVVLTAAEPVGETVLLQWTSRGDARVGGWEIVGQRGDAVRTVAVIRDPLTTELTITLPESGQVQYRVLARTAGGEVVAESNAVSVSAP